jgi:hypothetical protein
MMFDPKTALFASVGYLRRHPGEILRTLRNAARLRFGIPVVALQWLVTEFATTSEGGAKDVEIHPSPPGLRILATLEQMGTLLRGSCVVNVEKVVLNANQACVELRLKDVTVNLVDESVQTPLAALIRSGTLDLTRVASLVAYLPARPSALVEAVDDRLVIDLLKITTGFNPNKLRKIMGVLASLLVVEAVETDAEHLDIAFRALPQGIVEVLRR